MPTGTPNLERIKAAVSAEFPDAIYGQFNCRRRNAVGNWSQHAGSEPAKGYKGNAVDIVHKDHGYGDTSAAHQAWLDDVNAFLVVYRVELDLNELIWRKRNHYDHIHTSPWPKLHDFPLYKPPCKGGDLIVRYADKTRGDTFGDPGPPSSMEDDVIIRASMQNQNEAYYVWLQGVTTYPIGDDPGYWGRTGESGGPTDAEWDLPTANFPSVLEELVTASISAGALHQDGQPVPTPPLPPHSHPIPVIPAGNTGTNP